jgi:hypothetical protein
MKDVYATGSVTAQDRACAGGLVGHYDSKYGTAISTSYSLGKVSGKSRLTGGFMGFSKEELSISSAYWDIETSGKTNGAGNEAQINGVTGLTDAQLKSGLPEGFDPHIWGQSPNINNGYPYLRANPPQ